MYTLIKQLVIFLLLGIIVFSCEKKAGRKTSQKHYGHITCYSGGNIIYNSKQARVIGQWGGDYRIGQPDGLIFDIHGDCVVIYRKVLQ